MDFDDAPAEAAFRAEARRWLDRHAKPKVEAEQHLSVVGGFHDEPGSIEEARVWQRTLADAGWAAIHWPVAHGGRDGSPLEAMVFAEELARYDVPAQVCTIGIAMIGPTIIAHGSADQRDRYLRSMLRGDEIWCQLWSEPDAGSDLAGLRARAVRDGDEFVLDGQKVWTSGAHYAQFGLGIFRTDVEQPKHKGISCLVVDMASPGITVRPLRQITGGSGFNEVFFDGVRVPADNLVGELNDGWRVARTTLMNERYAAGALGSSSSGVEALLDLARSTGAALDPVVRQELAEVLTLGRLLDLTNARVRTSLVNGTIPGVEGSILKLAMATFGTKLAELGARLLGPAGVIVGPDAPEAGRWPDAVLGNIAMHIGGGTDEVQRNIIGELVLGLPREPATDRDVPFGQLAG